MSLSLLPLISSLALSAAPLQDSATPDLEAEIDKLLRWASSSTPGCAIAVAQDGEIVVWQAYGMADLENDVEMTPDTVFDVGSVTKQFVAAAVLLLVEEGHIALEDDVRDYFPELPDYDHVVTVEHLLTHTSGIRDWTGLLKLSSEPADALTLILRQRGLNFAPGEEWSYSNSGYVLLKELVARVMDGSFSEFVQSHIFEPLGMDATTYADDLEAGHENLAVAYEGGGNRWRKEVLVGNERGGGGALLSTVGDLILWNDALDQEDLGSFVTQKLQEPARLNNGRKLPYARGLSVIHARGRQIIWHGGSAGGYKAMVSRYPEHGVSIAMLSNSGDSFDGTPLIRRICDLMMPLDGSNAADVATESPLEADPPPVAVKSKAGLYFSEAGRPLNLIAQNGQLRVEGGSLLVPLADGRFRNTQPALSILSGDEFGLTFLSEDQFELKSMEGQITRYRRGQPPQSTAVELQAFAGRYESKDLKAVLEVGVQGDALQLRLGPQAIPFTAVDRDVFQFRRIMVRFRRNASEEVVALDFSNPVLRNVRFARLSEGTGGG